MQTKRLSQVVNMYDIMSEKNTKHILTTLKPIMIKQK